MWWNDPTISMAVLIALILAVYIAASLGVARWAASTGRKPLKWFYLALLTAGMAAVIAYRRDLKSGRIKPDQPLEPLSWQRQEEEEEEEEEQTPADEPAKSSRCPQCGQRVTGAEDRQGDMIKCSRCGYEFQETHLA